MGGQEVNGVVHMWKKETLELHRPLILRRGHVKENLVKFKQIEMVTQGSWAQDSVLLFSVYVLNNCHRFDFSIPEGNNNS